jgi:hypothetical protein
MLADSARCVDRTVQPVSDICPGTHGYYRHEERVITYRIQGRVVALQRVESE